jgi:hypothetical protein
MKTYICPRVTLTADTTIYVSTTGNDSNSGLAIGTPVRSPQVAWQIAGSFDTNGWVVTIKLADGTYSRFINSYPIDGQQPSPPSQWGGSGKWSRRTLIAQTTNFATGGSPGGSVIYVEGNATNPQNVIVDTSSLGATWWGMALFGSDSVVFMKGITFQNNFEHILVADGAQLYFTKCRFGTAVLSHVDFGVGSYVQAMGDNEIFGGGFSFYNIETGGFGFLGGGYLGLNTVFTFTGTVGFSYFLSMINGGYAEGDTGFVLVGNCTGKQFYADRTSRFQGYLSLTLPGSSPPFIQCNIGSEGVLNQSSYINLTPNAFFTLNATMEVDSSGIVAGNHEILLNSGDLYKLPGASTGGDTFLVSGKQNQILNGGWTSSVHSPDNVGTAYTASPGKGPLQYIFNDAALTIGPPGLGGGKACEGKIRILNITGAGSVTFLAGWGTAVGKRGDAITTTVGHSFLVEWWEIDNQAGYFVHAQQ